MYSLVKIRSRKLQAAAFGVLLVLSVFIFALPTAVAAVDSIGLSPSTGPVGSVVAVSEYWAGPNVIVPLQVSNRRYSIWFDINANGNFFESGELMKSGVTTSEGLISDSFIVPSSVGSNADVFHYVVLRDDTYGGYAYTEFFVTTSRDLTVPSSVRAGNNVTININLNGAGAFESRSYGVRVSGPNFTYTPWYSFSQITNATGSLSNAVYFPANFPGYSTGAVGSYTVMINETFSGSVRTFDRPFQVISNPAPNASITSITPNPAEFGQQITFTGVGTDINGSIIAYRWASNITGQLSTSRTFLSSLVNGTHLISFQVQDNDGLWSNLETTVLTVRPQRNLMAVIDAISVNQFTNPPEVTFNGHGTDAVGTIVAYRWQINLGDSLTTLSSLSNFSTNTLLAGDYTINFQVQNDVGTWSNVTSRTLTVPQPKSPPNASIDSISPGSAHFGQPVAFIGNGSDSDGTVVGYKWESSIDGVISTDSRFSTSSLNVGTHLISFQVQDNDSLWSSLVTQPLTIDPNVLPIAHLSPGGQPNSAHENRSVSFSGYGTDDDGSVVGWSWTSDRDGSLSNSPSFSTSSLSVGVHLILFAVQDNVGNWSSPVTFNLPVTANLAPVATIGNIPGEVSSGSDVTLSGDGVDSDGAVVAYRWISDKDGQFSDSATASTSGLSVGRHTISFEVQDDNGIWSLKDSRELIVSKKGLLPEIIIPPIAAGGAVALGLTYYISRPPSSSRINRSMKKKVEKENKRQEKDKKKQEKKRDESKPFLVLKASAPSMVFGSKIDAANLTLTNKGGCSAKDVVILASADSGVELKEPDKKPFSLNTNMPMPLTMPFSLNKARRGVYRLFFQASCQGAAKQDCACFMRAVKIGLLSTDANKVYADPLRAWMTEKGYVWDEVHDADDLRGTLFKYDLLVLAPELYLPDKWVHNLSSFVKNSQSLLVIDKVTTNQEQKMAELLGYSELKFEPFRSEVGQLKISGDTLGAGIGFVPSETFPLQGCWGNKCTSRVVTGKPLAEYTYTEKSGTPSSILAIAANIYGKGRVVHLNFHAEQTANQLENILEKTLNWLLCTDALPYSPEP